MWLLFLEARQLSLISLTCHQRFPFLFQELSVHMINYASIVAQYRVIKCNWTSWFLCDRLKKATNCKTKSISGTLHNHSLIFWRVKRVWSLKYHFLQSWLRFSKMIQMTKIVLQLEVQMHLVQNCALSYR